MNQTSVFGGFFERSLKNRVTLFTLALFLAGIWSLAWYASRELHKDIVRLLGEQQASTAAVVAASIDDDLKLRFDALEKVAASLAPFMRDSATLQAELGVSLNKRH